MAEKGWIKLHRRLLDCWIWDVKPFDKGRAWVDLLLLAMHHDKKIVIEDKPTIISRGSYFTSRGQLADRWGWSVKKVDTYLKTLEKEEMVTTHRTPKGTTITIVNYEEYQIEGTTKDTTEDTTVDIAVGTTVDTTEGTTIGTAVDIQNKNIKNYKNVKNEEELKNEKNIISSNSNELDCQTQDVRRALETWNELRAYGIKTVGKLKNGTQRYQMLQARIREYGIDDVLTAIDNIKVSDFLQGKHSGKPWQITFDWFVRPNNFPKVLDGNYSGDSSRQTNRCAQMSYGNLRDSQFANLMEQIRRDEEDDG